MDDNAAPPSGSRWEPRPTPPEDAGTAPPEPAGTEPTPPPAGGAPEPPAAPPRPRLFGRSAVAGVAVALLAAGAIGGFAIGRATAGTGTPDQRPGFDNVGQLPPDVDGDGGLRGRPDGRGFDDRDGDGQDGGQDGGQSGGTGT